MRYLKVMSLSFSDLTLAQLKRAVVIKEEIATLEAKLAAIVGTSPTPPAAAPKGAPKKRRLSAAGRAAIAAAARARWAKLRATAKAPKAPAKRKRAMGLEARKRMAEVAKARWAKARAEGRKTLAGK